MRALLALPLLATGSVLTAQVSSLTSPAYLAATEGALHCREFGSEASMRYQLLDPENRGSAATLSSLALRADYRDFNQTSGMGRSWSQVDLRIGNGDAQKFGLLSPTNFVGAATRVFSGRVTWPTLSGLPFARPDAWGGLSGQLRFGFSQPWQYSGQLDILSDWSLQGGSLANGSTWNTNLSADYYLDSYHDPSVTTAHAAYSTLPLFRLDNTSFGVTGRCNDPAIQSKIGATLEAEAFLANQNHHVRSWRDQLVIRTRSLGCAPAAPVIHAFGVIANPAGVDLNTGCNRLHISGPIYTVPYQTQPLSRDPRGASDLQTLTFPWSKALAGLTLVMQAAWADSGSGAIGLTQASTAILPQDFSPATIPSRRATYAVGSSSAVAPNGLPQANPVLQYR